MILRAVAATLLFGGAEATRLVATWSFSQPRASSSWAQWSFAQAGNFSIPANWGTPVVSWTFDGPIEASYVDQASVGAVCYEPVPPTTPQYPHVSLSHQCSAENSVDYAVGVWLWSGATALGGAWSVSVEYTPPSPASPPPPLPPPLAPPPPPAAGTAFATLSWMPVAVSFTQDGCLGGTPAKCTLSSGNMMDALVYSTLPTTMTGAVAWLGVFFMQSQNYTCTGAPAILGAYGPFSSGFPLLWASDLPNTPGGESCLNAGGDCPSCGLAMGPRPHAAIVPIAANTASLRTGYSPSYTNSWGTTSFSGTITYSASRPKAIRRLRAPQGNGWMAPGSWNTSWSSAASAHVSTYGEGAAFSVCRCASAVAEARFGWVPAGTATVAARASWTSTALATLSATFLVNNQVVATTALTFLQTTATGLSEDALSASTPIHEGYLTVRFTVASAACSIVNAVVTDIGARVTPPSVPRQSFVVASSAGQCLQAMQPLKLAS